MRKIKLGECSTIAISNVDKKSKEDEKEVFLCNFVDVYHNWSVSSRQRPELMPATAKDEQIKKFSLKQGQVAITKDSETRDDIGIPTYIAETMNNVILGYHTALITPDEDVLNGAYLNGYLNSPTACKYFEFHATGSGQRYTLTEDIISGMPLYLPSLETQTNIGDLLSNINDAIQCNECLTHELQSTAQLIYDYWFTQFDFPDENGKPYRSSGGKMVYSEELKREIPEGWEVDILGNLCNIKLGGTPSTSIEDYWNGDIPWLSSAEIANNPILKSDATITQIGMKESTTEHTSAGSILLSITRYIRASITGIDCCFNQSVVAIEPSEFLRTEFLYPVIGRQIPRYLSLRTGAQQPHINKETVSSTPIIIPPSNVLVEYYKRVEGLYRLFVNASSKSLELKSVRDWLLPMLMNGQVSIEHS